MNKNYLRYREYLSKIADLNKTLGLLAWDQEVFMPTKGASLRAQQLSTLSGITYDISVSQELEDLLNELSAQSNGLTFEEKRNVEKTLRDQTKAKKLDTDFVKRINRLHSESFEAWVSAKKNNDFKAFLPVLQSVVEITREKAERYGYKNHIYDALLDGYEPNMTTEIIDRVFGDVRTHLTAFYNKIKDRPGPDDSFLKGNYNKEVQLQLCKKIAKDLGYNFEAGRLDLSPHPFSISFSANDARITTFIDETDFSDSLWSTIHEVGHAMYEQGIPTSEYGLPSGRAASLSIHESQSRLWENNIGKSRKFLEAYFPVISEFFPTQLKGANAEKLFKAINKIKPNLIRIQSDEVTYHFHILLRYEIEKDLIAGKIEARHLPELWNEKIKTYLGLDVPTDATGVLQDIHWSHGSFGYFPTYSLGSFYAAQFFQAAQKEIPDIMEKTSNKQFTELLHWLRTNIHRHGETYSSEELCKKATGEELNFKYFMNYIEAKYENIYEK